MSRSVSAWRNLIIFSAVAVLAGWLGVALESRLTDPAAAGLGQLLWLAAPVVTGLLLRALGGDGWADFGWRPRFKGNLRWYALSLAVFPAAAGVIVGLGGLTGQTSLAGFTGAGLSVWLTAVGAGLLPAFIKNLFEEFAWRGYLAPRVEALGLGAWAGHVWVGLVWAAWHLPYYLYFMRRAEFAAYTSQPLAVFLPFFFAGVIVQAVVYGEIRRRTGSVWPAVLMHTAANALINPLVLLGLVKVAPGLDIIFSPTPETLVSIVIFGALGAALLRAGPAQATRAE